MTSESETKLYSRKYLDIAKSIVLGHVDRSKTVVFLFGSRAAGTNSRVADLDIGVWSHAPLGATRFKILDALEECVVPYHIDLVDFFSADPVFREIAGKEIVLWNDPPDWPANALCLRKRFEGSRQA